MSSKGKKLVIIPMDARMPPGTADTLEAEFPGLRFVFIEGMRGEAVVVDLA